MYLTKLSLTNFRNYRAVELPLARGLTILTGPNGAGKSNVLEAIHCLATGRSYRARSEAELRSIAPDPARPYTRVAGDVTAGEHSTTLEVIWAAEQDQDAAFSKRIRIGGAPRRASSLLQHLHVVLFTPHDIALVDGPPSSRRRYLDYLLSRIDPSYLRTLQGYEHVMAERNALLRALREGATRDLRQLEAWNHELTSLGATLIGFRSAYAAHVAAPLAACYAALAGTSGDGTADSAESGASNAARHQGGTEPLPRNATSPPGDAKPPLQNAATSTQHEHSRPSHEEPVSRNAESPTRQAPPPLRTTEAGPPRAGLPAQGPELRLRYEATVPLPPTPPPLDELRVSALSQAWLADIQTAFAAALAEQAPRERAQAVTVVGPHRDDLTFLRGNHSLAAYGSRGEQRLAALTLKLTEIALLQAVSGEWPVILLDDFLSELDAQRRQHVLASLVPNVQAFATTSDLQQFSPDVVANAQVMRVGNDMITPA